MAQHCWREQSPVDGDLAHWGAGLADFLAVAPQLADEPFLADVARLKWALYRAAIAADAAADWPSFALLSEEHPALLALCLCSGVWTLASAYPVVSLFDAHCLPALDQKPAFDFVRWLASAVKSGLVTGACRLPSELS